MTSFFIKVSSKLSSEFDNLTNRYYCVWNVFCHFTKHGPLTLYWQCYRREWWILDLSWTYNDWRKSLSRATMRPLIKRNSIKIYLLREVVQGSKIGITVDWLKLSMTIYKCFDIYYLIVPSIALFLIYSTYRLPLFFQHDCQSSSWL